MRDWEGWVRQRLNLPAMTDRRDLRCIRELATHLEDAWQEARANGATEEEADAAAGAMLSDRERAIRDLIRAERHHAVAEAERRVERTEDRLRAPGSRLVAAGTLLRDVRLGLRSLARQPLFACTVVLVLAIGIGTTTSIFALVDAVVISPLPFPDADRLVDLRHSSRSRGGGNVGQCAAWHYTYEDENRVFEDLGMYGGLGTAAVTGRGEPEAVPAMRVTSGVFRTLRVSPIVGRVFTRADEAPDAAAVVMLGHGYWRSRFGANPDIVGTTLRVDGTTRTIVGVLPRSVASLGPEPSVVTLLAFRRAGLFVGNVGFTGIARLKPGITREQAVADMTRMLPMAFEKFPGGPVASANRDARYEPDAQPLKDVLVGNVRRLLWVLLASVAGVLLIACTNVANLFLVRAESRGRELAVRAALGAGGPWLIWEHIRESLVLAVVGGMGGLVVAWAALRTLVAVGPTQVPRLAEVTFGPRVFAFGLAVAAATAIFVSAVPMLKRRDWRTFDALKQGGRGSGMSRSRHRILNGLASAQIALALVLLVGLGLVVRSGLALRQVDAGFSHAGDILALRVALPVDPALVQAAVALAREQNPDQPRIARFLADQQREQAAAALMQEAIARRLSSLPGVTSVAMATDLPMHAGGNINPLFVDGVTTDGKTPPLTRRHKWIGEGYFETLGIPLLAGRAFTWQDIHARLPAAMVSESLARSYWGSAAAAIGKRVAIRPDPVRWHEVIGVVGDVRENGVNLDPVPMVYWPQVTLAMFQGDAPDSILLWRTVSYGIRSPRLGTPGFQREVQQAVWSVNKDLPLRSVGRLQDFVAQSWASTTFMLALLGVAAAIALVLGLVGVYGVLSYVVSQRTVELGLRMVLGADAGDVRRLVLGQAARVVGVGTIIGLALSIWGTSGMSSLLFGVAATDVTTFVTVTVALALVALCASYLPARRAARVPPIIVMRAEQ